MFYSIPDYFGYRINESGIVIDELATKPFKRVNYY